MSSSTDTTGGAASSVPLTQAWKMKVSLGHGEKASRSGLASPRRAAVGGTRIRHGASRAKPAHRTVAASAASAAAPGTSQESRSRSPTRLLTPRTSRKGTP